MELPLYPYIVLALLAFNVAAFFLFGYDKLKARKDQWRVSESSLLLLALVGPFGAYCGMKVFRHKTSKFKFILVPAFILLHLAVLIYVVVYVI